MKETELKSYAKKGKKLTTESAVATLGAVKRNLEANEGQYRPMKEGGTDYSEEAVFGLTEDMKPRKCG